MTASYLQQKEFVNTFFAIFSWLPLFPLRGKIFKKSFFRKTKQNDFRPIRQITDALHQVTRHRYEATRMYTRSRMLPLWYPDHHRSGRRYACRIRQITDALHQVIRYRYEVPRACTHDHACCRYDIRITTGAAAGMRAGSVRSWTHCIRPRGTHQITDALHRSRSTSAVPPRQGTTTTTS